METPPRDTTEEHGCQHIPSTVRLVLPAGTSNVIRFPASDKELPGLVHFNRARQELELAATIDEVKEIRDRAEAMRVYARQVQYSLEMQNRCAEIRLRAERRLGEMLRESGLAENSRANLLRGRSVQPRDRVLTLAGLGICKSLSSRLQLISTISPEQFEERVQTIKDSGRELTTGEFVAYAKALRREENRVEKRSAGLKLAHTAPPEERIKLVHGDFREVLTESFVGSDSVDLVLTDPPYGEAYLPLWKDLAAFAARTLRKGRLLVTYCGKYYLPEVMTMLSRHLDYVWTAVVIYESSPDTIFPRRIKTYWKPVLLFARGEYRPLEKLQWFKDRIQGDGRTKAHHDWEQGLGECMSLIESFTLKARWWSIPSSGLERPRLRARNSIADLLAVMWTRTR